jgi:hypothetical protein
MKDLEASNVLDSDTSKENAHFTIGDGHLDRNMERNKAEGRNIVT